MIRRTFSWRPARYMVVGAICAMANMILMIAGDWVGIHYAPMTVVAFVLVTPMGYFLHAAFTFSEKMSWRSFAKFTSGVAAGYPISLLSFAILCSALGLSVAVAAPIATVILFVWNYVLAHWAILGRLGVR